MLLFSILEMSFTIKKSFCLVTGGFFILVDVLQVTVSGCDFEQLGAMVKGCEGCEVTLSFNSFSILE
jgi:hypothetical protein